MKILTIIILVIIGLVIVVGAVMIRPSKEIKTNELKINDKINESTWFKQLPPKPDDLIIFKNAVERGEINDLCRLKEEYYSQPEFYINWDKGRKIFYEGHDYSRWGVHGYGAYPSEVGASVSNLKQGEEISLCTLFKTSYGIETYQGLKLIYDSNEFFDVEILPQESDKYKDHFLMFPTFPEFNKNWVKLITIKLKAKKDIPIGNYKISFNVAPPDGNFKEEKVWELLMKDTNKNIDYVMDCVNKISKSENNSKIDSECERFMMERQKRYVDGGGWSIGRDIFSVNIKVQ